MARELQTAETRRAEKAALAKNTEVVSRFSPDFSEIYWFQHAINFFCMISAVGSHSAAPAGPDPDLDPDPEPDYDPDPGPDTDPEPEPDPFQGSGLSRGYRLDINPGYMFLIGGEHQGEHAS